MRYRVIKEGNAFYEIDEECLYKKQKQKENAKRAYEAKRKHVESQEKRRSY